MPASVPILLLTRPLEASHRFARLMQDRVGARVQVCVSPLIEIRPLVQRVEFGDARGLIITSANGLKVISALTSHRDLPLFCVGQSTADLAQTLGWRVQTVGQDAKSLIDTLAQTPATDPLLHIRGIHSRGDVAANLTRLGLSTTELIAYDQVALGLSAEAKHLLTKSNIVIAPFFSPRTVKQFAKHDAPKATMLFAALSDAVAAELPQGCLVAQHPTASGMADIVESLVNSACRVEASDEGQ
jgi:uroporphyrinogen-III synthase